MSKFTRNRKKIRLSRAAIRKQQDENSKKFDKAMEDHLETCRIIKRDYPGYDNMSPKNALDLYFKIYNNLHSK